ncbi:MAG: N-acetylmuramoyl-L-alanine amidase [Ectobacillus sp.]
MKKTLVMASFIILFLLLGAFVYYAFWSESRDQKIIVLDPGHGGKYPGFESHGVMEKDIVFQISLYAKEELERRGYKVYMTRQGDIECNANGYLKDLSCRPKLARKVHADLFVSIHANAFSKNEAVRGIESFYFTPFHDKKAAETLADSLAEETGMPVRFVKFGNFKVLRESTVPSVLIEIGYITNRDDFKLLSLPESQKQIALGIVRGIEEYVR